MPAAVVPRLLSGPSPSAAAASPYPQDQDVLLAATCLAHRVDETEQTIDYMSVSWYGHNCVDICIHSRGVFSSFYKYESRSSSVTFEKVGDIIDDTLLQEFILESVHN